MRIEQSLEWARDQLLQTDLDAAEALFDAELLLAFSLNKARIWLKTWPEKELSSSQLNSFHKLIHRRQSGEPMAYITGKKEFWSLDLRVSKDTLIPRPETELLVELALEKIPLKTDFRLADLGTGTGAIALAIASERPQAIVYAVDFSEEALKIATQNREQLGLANVSMLLSNWLADFPVDLSASKLDLIVSNPPYVEANDPHLVALRYEPYQALVAADKGLADIKSICLQAKQHLNSGAYLMFEHGFEQAEAVRAIFEIEGFSQIETQQDLAGKDRVTLGCYQPTI